MDGVILISYINMLRVEKGYGLEQAIREGVPVQLRRNMMMMIVAILGLIPAAIKTGIGSDIQRPLAT